PWPFRCGKDRTEHWKWRHSRDVFCPVLGVPDPHGASVLGQQTLQAVRGEIYSGNGSGVDGCADAGEVDEGTVAYVNAGDCAVVDGLGNGKDAVGWGDVYEGWFGDACGGEDVGRG